MTPVAGTYGRQAKVHREWAAFSITKGPTVTVPILRTSERADLGRCPQRWWWAWRMGLRKRGYTPDALWFGTGVHIALATWYVGPGAKRGAHPAETFEQWAAGEIRSMKTERAMDDETETNYIDARALGRVMLEGYVALYGRDEHKLIISPEKTFALDVPWPADQKLWEEQPLGTLLRYCGTFDSVWRHADTGQIWLDEHKTAQQISIGHLTLDPQAGGYWAVAGRVLRNEKLIGTKERLAGIEYNFLRKAEPDTRPRDADGYACNKPTKAHYIEQLTGIDGWTEPELKKMKLEALEGIAAAHMLVVLGERSKQQPAKNFERVQVNRTTAERNSQLVRLQREGIVMDAYRNGILPIIKHPDRTCNQGAFRCPYFELCEVDEAGGDTAGFIEAAFDVQDPYADHRLR